MTGSRDADVGPISERWWTRTWLLTAGVGNLILIAIFVAYELVERIYLRQHHGVDDLFRFHMYRGLGASVLVASWAFYNVRRMRRRYDHAFEQAYRKLEGEMNERTVALAQAQAFTERLFDAMHDRLLVLDPNGVVLKANRVALEAAQGRPLIGYPCTALDGVCAPDQGCVARRALRDGRPAEALHSHPATGRVFTIDAVPVLDASGRCDAVIEIIRDVTVAKQMEARLRAQEKLAAVGMLAAGIAHDIANPLASMSSELELMELERDPGKLQEAVAVLRGSVARIGRTLRDMTEFARRRGEEQAPIAIEVAIEDALRMVRHDPRARKVRFKVEIEPGLPSVLMVEDQLVMVLVNLFVNAFDAMTDGGGEIALRTERIRDRIRVSVADTGAGMSEEVLRRATEPMFTTKGGGRGTGLGLSISADVMRAAGGALDIDSTPRSGTTVHLTLPAVAHA